MFFFEDCYIDKNQLWCTAYRGNALLKYDLETNNMIYIGSFPNEEYTGYRLYSQIIRYGSKLYFTPCRAKEIGVFDLESNEFSKIKFEDLNIGFLKNYGGWNFYSACEEQGCIYFFPHQRTSILKYNTKSHELIKIDEWYNKNINRLEEMPSLFFKIAKKGHKIYVPYNYMNALMVFDLREEKEKMVLLTGKNSGYAAAQIINNEIWLVPLTGCQLTVYNLIDNDIHIINLKGKQQKYMFWDIQELNDKLYAFPNQYTNIVEIETNTKKIVYLKTEAVNRNGESKYICSKRIGGAILNVLNDGQLYLFNGKTQQEIKFVLIHENTMEELMYNILCELIDKAQVILESENIDLRLLLKNIVHLDKD